MGGSAGGTTSQENSGNGGGQPGGSGSPAPAGTGTGGSGGGSPAPANPPANVGLSEDDLPEEIRRLPAAQRKMAIQGLITAARSAAQMRQELEKLKAKPDSEKSGAEKQKEKRLEDLIYDNPEEAIDQVTQKRYGGRLKAIEEISGRAAFTLVEREYPDLMEYEEDIKQILEASGADSTPENIIGAYSMAVGQRTIQERRREKQRVDNPEMPKGGDATKAKPKLTDLEREIMLGMGMDEEKYLELRDKGNYLEVEV